MSFHIDLTSIEPLDDLLPHIPVIALQRLFAGQPWATLGPAYLLVANFVRLVDLAISEYEAGRAAFSTYYNPDSQHAGGIAISAAVRASGHFEHCLTDAHRAIQHCRRSRRHRSIPPGLRARLPQGPEVLSGKGDGTLNDFRDLIQHLEERLLGLTKKGPAIGEHEMALLMLNGDKQVDGTATTLVLNRLEAGPLRLPLATLAGWLRELHDRARQVVEYPVEG